MAQTWRVTPLKKFAFRTIDLIGAPLKPLLGRVSKSGRIRRVLVLEPWHIGDVVIATAALRAIRESFPGAHITLLGKAHAEELVRHSGLADEVIVVDLPWTSKESKYDPRRYDRSTIRALVRRLQAMSFDLTVDARMDLRSNVLTFMTKAPMRVGFAFGGGKFLLTHAVPADPDRDHRVDDWMRLLEPVLPNNSRIAQGVIPDRFEPFLRVTADERQNANRTLQALGVAPDEPLVGIHGGASDARRMWPIASYLSIAHELAGRYGTQTLLFLEPGASAPSSYHGATVRTTLREMMALFTCCSVVVCNDSGPMHIADALGVPVVAVFLTGNPVWHRPFGANQEFVGAGTGHDVVVRPTEREILEAAERQLARSGIEPREPHVVARVRA